MLFLKKKSKTTLVPRCWVDRVWLLVWFVPDFTTKRERAMVAKIHLMKWNGCLCELYCVALLWISFFYCSWYSRESERWRELERRL